MMPQFRRPGSALPRPCALSGAMRRGSIGPAAAPLSFGSIFPGASTRKRVTLDGDRAAESMPRLVVALVDAAAATARHPDRLDLSDRLRGRTPIASRPPTCNMAPVRGTDGRVRRGAPSAPRSRPPHECRGRGCCGPRSKKALARACSKPRGGSPATSPQVMLRVAAARFASYQDDAGSMRCSSPTACCGASPRCRGPTRRRSSSPSSAPARTRRSPWAGLRRASACCAPLAPAEKLAFIRDDLFDDMRYAGLLVGMDQERTLLIEVFRSLEKARRADLRPATRACGVRISR